MPVPIKRVVKGDTQKTGMEKTSSELSDKRKAWLEEAQRRIPGEVKTTISDPDMHLSDEYVAERDEQREQEGSILSKGAKTLEEALVIRSMYPDCYLDMLKGTSQDILDQLAKIVKQDSEDDENVDMFECTKFRDFILMRGQVYVTGERWYSADKRKLHDKKFKPPLEYKDEDFDGEEAAAEFVKEENEFTAREEAKFLQ